ncbi:MAG: hypothetical protein WCO63_12580 [Bacteroidota bacterium]
MIPDKNNRWYSGKVNPGLAMDLVVSSDRSCKFINYILDQYNFKKDLLFPGENIAALVPDNLDFLLRYYKRNAYFPEPQVHLVDRGKRGKQG